MSGIALQHQIVTTQKRHTPEGTYQLNISQCNCTCTTEFIKTTFVTKLELLNCSSLIFHLAGNIVNAITVVHTGWHEKQEFSHCESTKV